VSHRVVVTGLGVESPIGRGVAAFREALRAGRCGGGPITVFDASTISTHIAAECSSPAHGASTRDRKVAFALAAAHEAMTQACAPGTSPGGSDGGAEGFVSMGVGLELFSMDDLVASRVPGFALPTEPAARRAFLQTPSDACVHELSRLYGLRRPPLTLVSACAAGTDALGVAFHAVRSGRRRWALAGGTDSMINPLGVAGFAALHAMTTRNDAPTAASRPFDRSRDGFLLGEGAGVLVLERLDDARARGAPVLGEIVGYGTSFDALGISEPHPEGAGALLAMRGAIADAGLSPDAIDLVNAHGTSTPKNDVVETLALRRLFGARASQVPVTAMKSMIGHLISGAGAVETVGAFACLAAGFVSPTMNLHSPDPACDLDYVPLVARASNARVVLKTSFAFGGQNAALVLAAAP
jgi:3-oxoacyl-[acyl-carrier-protein] synthase II